MNPEFPHFDEPNQHEGGGANTDLETVPEEVPTKRAQVGKRFLQAAILTGALLQAGDQGGAVGFGKLTAEELQPKKRTEQYMGDEFKAYSPAEFLSGCETSPIEFIKYFPQFHGKPEVARQTIEMLLQKRPDVLVYGARWLGPYKTQDLLLEAASRVIKRDMASAKGQLRSDVLLEAAEEIASVPGGEQLLLQAYKLCGANPIMRGILIRHIETYYRFESFRPAIEKDSRQAALQEPGVWIFDEQLKSIEKINPPWFLEHLTIALQTLAHQSPVTLFNSAEVLSRYPVYTEALKTALPSYAENYPDDYLQRRNAFRGIVPGYDSYVRRAVEHAVTKKPDLLLLHPELYADLPDHERWHQKGAEGCAVDPENAVCVLSEYGSIIDKPWGKRLLDRAARTGYKDVLATNAWRGGPEVSSDFEAEATRVAFQTALDRSDPEAILKSGAESLSYPFAREYVSKAVDLNPFYAVRLNPNTLLKLDSRVARWLASLNETDRHELEFPAAFAYVEELMSGAVKISDVKRLTQDEDAFFRHLMKKKASGTKFGWQNIDNALSESALRYVHSVNDAHELTDAKRFEGVESLTPSELYTTIVYGEQEIYTSSFNGLLTRCLRKMARENIDGYKLVEQNNFNHFRSFVKMLAGYGRLGDFLTTMSEPQRQELMLRFVKDVHNEPNALKEAVTIADAFESLGERPAVMEVVEREIKKQYTDASGRGDIHAQRIYGLLASIYSHKGGMDKNWLDAMAERYKLESQSELETKDVFNSKGENNQRYYFYNDEDGKSSFASFMAQYRGRPGWKVMPYADFVVVEKTALGKKVRIVANRPEVESSQSLDTYVKELGVEPQVIVHRGHSFHAPKTIEEIKPTAKLVWLGSCGGYNALDEVYAHTPNGLVFSTKATGVKAVNDPILAILNEQILLQQNEGKLDLYKVWQIAEQRLGRNKDFASYVPPYRNLAAMFLKAYNRGETN